MAFLFADRLPRFGALTGTATAHRYSGVAPLAVFFTTDVSSSYVTYPFHQLRYTWNFDDSGSGTFSYGARANISQNVAYGPRAAHLFQTPGTYDVTCEVFDGYSYVTLTVATITVSDPDDYAGYSGNNTICVSTSGDFDGAPDGALEVTSSDFDNPDGVALATYLNAGKRVLFCGGETFTASTHTTYTGSGPAQVGSYGTGRAIIDGSPGSSGFIAVSLTSNDLRVTSLEFYGDATTGQRWLSFQNTAWTNVLLFDNDVHGYDNALNGVDWAGSGGSGFFVFENSITAPEASSNWDSVQISQGNYVAVIGNNIDQNNVGQQVVRLNAVTHGVVSANTVANSGASDKEVIGLRAGVSSVMQYVIVSDNAVTIGDGYAAIYPQWQDGRIGLYDVILERNLVSGAAGNSSSFGIGINAIRGTIRNNIIDASDTDMVIGIAIRGTNGGFSEASQDVWVYNNAVYSSQNTGSLTAFQADADVSTGCEIRNNAAYAPNISGTAVTAGGATASDNSSSVQMAGTCPFTDTTPSAVADYAAANYAAGGGLNTVPVFDDALSQQRSYGFEEPVMDMGAVKAS